MDKVVTELFGLFNGKYRLASLGMDLELREKFKVSIVPPISVNVLVKTTVLNEMEAVSAIPLRLQFECFSELHFPPNCIFHINHFDAFDSSYLRFDLSIEHKLKSVLGTNLVNRVPTSKTSLVVQV